MDRQSKILQVWWRQFVTALRAWKETVPFTRRHRLWEGVLDYGWLVRILIVGVVLLGLKMSSVVVEWFTSVPAAVVNPLSLAASSFELFADVISESYHYLVFGSFKYIIVIVTEVLISHFGIKTTRILRGSTFEFTFADFLQDQWRVVLVSIRKYVMEVVITAIAGVVLGLVSLQFLTPLAAFIIQCYFLGFVIMDNYYKHQELSIRESSRQIYRYAGITVGVGGIFYLLLLIPLAGVLLAPCLAAVASVMAIHLWEEEQKPASRAVLLEEAPPPP